MTECFRWFGPGDPVPLRHIRQAGATAVFTALHEIPYGEAWPREAIRERKALVEAAGLRWCVVESVPVHEDIKTGQGDLRRLLDNYLASLRHLADEDIRTVIYNFMPVLDWVRTDMRWEMPDGSFFEASHLGGPVDMPAVVAALLDAQARRSADDPMPFRSDHGHRMMDDLAKPEGVTPGYSCIGRMKGLAELRGLMLGLRWKAR